MTYTAVVQTTDIDLPTLVSLAGPGVTDHLLARVVDGGFSGVKRSHGYVIQRLVNDEPTITALAHTLGMTQQGASKQVTELENLGLVVRFSVEGDQRVRRVRLSSKGEQLLAAGHPPPSAGSGIALPVNHLGGMTEMSPVGTVGAPPGCWDQMSEDEQFAYLTRPGRRCSGSSCARRRPGQRPPTRGKSSGKLQTRGAAVVKRYFKKDADCVDADQWFDTGDVAGSIPMGQSGLPIVPRT